MDVVQTCSLLATGIQDNGALGGGSACSGRRRSRVDTCSLSPGAWGGHESVDKLHLGGELASARAFGSKSLSSSHKAALQSSSSSSSPFPLKKKELHLLASSWPFSSKPPPAVYSFVDPVGIRAAVIIISPSRWFTIPSLIAALPAY